MINMGVVTPSHSVDRHSVTPLGGDMTNRNSHWNRLTQWAKRPSVSEGRGGGEVKIKFSKQLPNRAP